MEGVGLGGHALKTQALQELHEASWGGAGFSAVLLWFRVEGLGFSMPFCPC